MFNTNKRGAALRNIANKLDLEYQPTDEWGILPQLQDFKLFRSGFNGKARHILSRQDELMESTVHIFDYRYLVWSGKSTRKIEQTVFFLESQKLGLPEFYMQPERFFHRIGELLSLTEDIDFEGHIDFSYNYRLTGKEEGYIRHSFKEDVLRFFAIEKGWSMEGMGFYLVLYKKNKILKPILIEGFYNKGLGLYEQLSDPLL